MAAKKCRLAGRRPLLTAIQQLQFCFMVSNIMQTPELGRGSSQQVELEWLQNFDDYSKEIQKVRHLAPKERSKYSLAVQLKMQCEDQFIEDANIDDLASDILWNIEELKKLSKQSRDTSFCPTLRAALLKAAKRFRLKHKCRSISLSTAYRYWRIYGHIASALK